MALTLKEVEVKGFVEGSGRWLNISYDFYPSFERLADFFELDVNDLVENGPDNLYGDIHFNLYHYKDKSMEIELESTGCIL